MELNDVIKELEKLKARVSELENMNKEIPDISKRAKWVAADKGGSIFAFSKEPKKGIYVWFPQKDDWFESITEEQAIALCGIVPHWPDNPIPVKK